MSELLDEAYLKWLYNQVEDLAAPITYWRLLNQLYRKEFVWFVPNDDNRVEDGKDLRLEFLHGVGLDDEAGWALLGCSMLELLIGVARRLHFQADKTVSFWFWRMAEHIRLSHLDDQFDPWPESTIDDILNEVIYRTYHPSGQGGLFPLTNAHEDQRKVEIWYQLSAYLIETMF